MRLGGRTVFAKEITAVLTFIILLSIFSGDLMGQAQGQGGKTWEIEVHAGSVIHDGSGGGAGALFPDGEPFTVLIRPLVFGSRRVSSWYFGDGATLFNVAAARFSSDSVPQIRSMDSVLTGPAINKGGATFGFRLSRRLYQRLTAEFTFERSGSISIDDQAVVDIEATRASFAAAFGAALNASAQSTSTINKDGRASVFSTGALLIDTPRYRRIRPFVTLGGGVISRWGDPANAMLLGSYDLRSVDVITDTVKVEFDSAKRRSFAALVGGGLKVPITARWGARVDIAAYFYRNPVTTSLSAFHTDPQTLAFIVADAPNAGSAFNPFVSFVPMGSLVGEPGPPPGTVSSLSGAAISGFQSFRERGVQNQIRLSLGTYWRF